MRAKHLTRAALATLLLSAASGGAMGQTPPSAAREPLELIPADCLFCWHARVHPDATSQPAQDSSVAALMGLGASLFGRSLDASMLGWVRAAEAAGELNRREFALALLDARVARPEGQVSARVESLDLALVVRTDGDSAPLRRLIQRVVNDYVDASTARLVVEHCEGLTYQELRDERLPSWARFAWGDVGSHFVVTIGDGTWQRIAAVSAARRPPLAADEWLRAARAEWRGKAQIEVYGDVASIRARLDEAVERRVSEFLGAWEAAELERAYWALGFERSALFNAATLRWPDRTEKRMFADAATASPEAAAFIPDGARYAIYNIPPRRLLPALSTSILATRNEPLRASVLRYWRKVTGEQQVDVQREILEQFGERLILHNFPPHPLRIPGAMTIVLPIRGDAALVRAALDRLARGWVSELAGLREAGRYAAPFELQRDSDGVWFVQIGLAGPAWTVNDKALIVSWSPSALREYVEWLDRADRTSTRPASPGR